MILSAHALVTTALLAASSKTAAQSVYEIKSRPEPKVSCDFAGIGRRRGKGERKRNRAGRWA